MSETLYVSARLAAPAARVRRALTDEAELRAWFAEHAEVALPDTYAFWGRFTPDGERAAQEPLHADDTTLRFAWHLGGTDTTTEITLAEDRSGATTVTVAQTGFPGWGAVAGGQDTSVLALLGTFWNLAVANLADHVEDRSITGLVDFTSADLAVTLDVGAPAAEVYDALMNPEKFGAWFNFPIELEPHVGGRWAMGGFDANPEPARITELEPAERISIDFGAGLGVSTWEMAESGGRTSLTFVQSGFDTANPPYAGWAGWLSGLAELRRFVEQGPAWTSMWIDPATAADTAPAAG